MNQYVILRRQGWSSPDALGAAAKRSAQVGDEEMSDDVRWIRSYVIDEGDGVLGTVCIYEGTSATALLEHANRAGLPATEVIAIADTVIVRPDPVAATA
jgi:Protein of unknown function (DUF4242)